MRWRGKENEQACRIGTVLGHQGIRVDGIALRFAHLRTILEHHPLCQKSLKRLIDIVVTEVTQHFGKETCIEQVQNGVFYPADVLIYPQPVVCIFLVNAYFFPLFGVGRIAELVPARLHERIKRIGLTDRFTAALRTVAVLPCRMVLQRVPFTGDLHIIRQCYGKVFKFFRYQTTVWTVYKRDRCTPITLTADTPVTQFVVGRSFAFALFLHIVGDSNFCLFIPYTAETAAVDEGTVSGIRQCFSPLDDTLDRQTVLGCKLEVTFIMGRYRHHCTPAVACQYEVRCPDRDFLTRKRVNDRDTQRVPLFILLGTFHFTHIGNAFDLLCHLCFKQPVFDKIFGNGVLRCKR